MVHYASLFGQDVADRGSCLFCRADRMLIILDRALEISNAMLAPVRRHLMVWDRNIVILYRCLMVFDTI